MVRLGKQLLPLFALGLMASFAQAQTQLCIETDSGATAGNAANGKQIGGCVNSIQVSDLGVLTNFYVASDGEVPFDPFGFGADTTDGIILDANWKQDPASTWTQIVGNSPDGTKNANTWILPSNLGNCGGENEPVCEPVGKWTEANSFWNGTFVYTMVDSLGLSDRITLDNSGVGGFASVTFASDPIVPEPTSLGFLAAGAVVLVGALKRRKASEAKNATL
jgi:hypothetical protein